MTKENIEGQIVDSEKNDSLTQSKILSNRNIAVGGGIVIGVVSAVALKIGLDYYKDRNP